MSFTSYVNSLYLQFSVSTREVH